MGRPERPIDAAAGPVAEFAAELRKLREKAGRPSYRELARRASFSVTVLSDAAGGRYLPTLSVVRGYVQACGGDVAEWEDRWLQAADSQRAESANGVRSIPYRGLDSYGVEHAALFFGRQTLTRDLLQRLQARRFLAVFGASGSGKSSLLRAGLLAALRRGELDGATGWDTALITPGEQPMTELERVLKAQPAGTELLLVVDQFEELFTVCGDQEQRDRFVETLLGAVADDNALVRVVLGVRADFYAHCAAWPGLVTALSDAQVLVGPMDRDQLRDVIVKPAEHAGMAVENALVVTALAETSTEPGSLALVSHALLETWRHSPPGRLTLTAYQEAGGVPHAIAATAERVYVGCAESERDMLRRIFLRLVAVGDGTPDTRRRVPPAELGEPATAALIETLVQARLVTIDDGSVQLAHEALISHWPRLAEWLADGRDGMRVQRRLADAASEWIKLRRDPAALYRGTPLAVARGWAERDAGLTGLTPTEREFLEASSAAEAVSQAGAVRATRRLRRLVAALIILLGAVTAAGVVAGWQRQTAVVAENAAVSGQLAAQSGLLAPVNPDAAALAAWHAEPTVAARSALLSTAACCTSTQTSLHGEYATVSAVALSPGGNLLAVGGHDSAVHVWNTADGRQRAVLRGFSGEVQAVAFSPSGSVLAAGSAGGTIMLWNRTTPTKLAGGGGSIEDLAFRPDGSRNVANPADPRIVRQLAGATQAITNLAYSPAGTMIAGEEPGGDVLLWNLDRGTRLLLPHAGIRSRGLAFSRDGTVLLTAGSYYNVLLWDTATGRLVASDAHRIPGGTLALAYDPNSGSLALGGTGGVVQIWRGSIPPFTGSAGAVTGLAVSPDPDLIVSVGGDDLLRLWTMKGGLMATRDLGDRPAAIAAAPDGKLLAVAGTDGNITVRDVPALSFVTRLRTRAPAADVALSHDGRMVAVAARAMINVWDARDGARRWDVYSSHGFFDAVAFSPDGSALAAVTSDGSVRIWNATTGKRIAEANPVTGSVNAVAFSPSGRLLATAGDDGTITLWDATNLRRLAPLAGPVGSIRALAFSPDGQILASGEGNGTILLWDVARGSLTATLTDGAAVKALAFTPDGGTLVSGDSSHRIVAWDLDPADVARQACRTLASDPGLSQAETLVPNASYPLLCPPGS